MEMKRWPSLLSIQEALFMFANLKSQLNSMRKKKCSQSSVVITVHVFDKSPSNLSTLRSRVEAINSNLRQSI